MLYFTRYKTVPNLDIFSPDSSAEDLSAILADASTRMFFLLTMEP